MPPSQNPPAPSSRSWASTVPLIAGGSMLEFYEFQTYALFAGVIANTFFSPSSPEWLRQLQAFAVVSVAFFFRPLSGALIGMVGDKLGRKTSFLITILLMALPTLGLGLLPGYATLGVAAPIILVLLRIMQGMASAGEMAGAAVYVTEVAPRERKGLASGTLYGSIHFGYFLAALVATLISLAMPPAKVQAYGWRIAFVLGGAMGLLTLLVRKRLHETPEFERMKASRAQVASTPFKAIFKQYRSELFTVVLLGGYVGVVIAIVYVYAPTFLQTAFKVQQKSINGTIAASFIVLSLSALAWGRLSDRIGFARVIAIGGGLVIAVSAGFCADFTRALHSPGLMLLWFLLMSISLGSVGCVFALACALFRADVRLTGFGVAYNLGLAVFLGTAPFTLTYLAHRFGGMVYIYYLWFAVCLGLIAAYRTRGLDLARSSDLEPTRTFGNAANGRTSLEAI